MVKTMTTIQELIANAKSQIEEIGVDEVQAFLENERPFVIDVREAAELINGFVPGADNIPRGVLEFKIQNHDEVTDKARTILVYCQSGMRGALATHVLRQLGYSQSVNLMGGFDSWLNKGLPVDKDPDTW